jgi:diguanylate cyclase (GGDEF)-like protein
MPWAEAPGRPRRGRHRLPDQQEAKPEPLSGWARAILADIAVPAVTMPPEMRVAELDDWFRGNPRATTVVVPMAAGPIVVDRAWFDRWVAGAVGYGRSVFKRMTLADLDEVPSVFLTADTSIDAAAAVVTDEAPGEEASVSTVGVIAPDGRLMTVSVTTLFRALSMSYAYQARHDVLTGLPNRASLMEWMRGHDARSGDLTVLYIDLDRFKDVNDSLGHAVGDQVLQLFAQRLQNIARTDDRVARLGGDEFAMVLAGALTADESRSVAERIVHEASMPFTVTVDHGDGQQVEAVASIGASVGVAGADSMMSSGVSLEDLVSQADLAMFQSKSHGRGRVTHFNAEVLATRGSQSELRARHHMERRLRLAIANGGLRLHYQPLAEVASNRIVGAEALARWADEELGPVSPVDFIKVAEETGLIIDLGRWALRTACREAATWPMFESTDGIRRRMKVTVNVSAVQLSQPSFVRDVADALAESGLLPRTLCLEITETAVIGDMHATAKNLQEIRDLGVTVALDDFGTGYSSLTMLRDLPADVVKIDKSFIDKIAEEASTDSVLARLVIETAHSLGMSVCAEGVETNEQAERLAKMGCDTLQGWLISKALPGSEAFTEWLPTAVLPEALANLSN